MYTPKGEFTGEVSGKFRYDSKTKDEYPCVGDWVATNLLEQEKHGIIHAILPRNSKFSRKDAGIKTEEQVLAANFDYIFIVMSLNKDFNLRRLERYLITAWDSGGLPIIILSKADMCDDVNYYKEQTELVAPGVDVHIVSAVTHEGTETIKRYLETGKTVAVIGSSGVGKSTLLNVLSGTELMATGEIRENDSRGRHTTTHRQLFILPKGGLYIDSPGIRELNLWDGEDTMDNIFEDIATLSEHCKFSDCTHEHEPGCAVKEAIIQGTLESKRLISYKKLQRELRYMETKKRNAERIQKKRTK